MKRIAALALAAAPLAVATFLAARTPARAEEAACPDRPGLTPMGTKPLPGGKACMLSGKVKFVTSFPDYKIQLVDAFPDIKVQKVSSFPDKPGKWQVVDSFPDFTVQVVTSFPDFKVKYVDSFPGCP